MPRAIPIKKLTKKQAVDYTLDSLHNTKVLFAVALLEPDNQATTTNITKLIGVGSLGSVNDALKSLFIAGIVYRLKKIGQFQPYRIGWPMVYTNWLAVLLESHDKTSNQKRKKERLKYLFTEDPDVTNFLKRYLLARAKVTQIAGFNLMDEDLGSFFLDFHENLALTLLRTKEKSLLVRKLKEVLKLLNDFNPLITESDMALDAETEQDILDGFEK